MKHATLARGGTRPPARCAYGDPSLCLFPGDRSRESCGTWQLPQTIDYLLSSLSVGLANQRINRKAWSGFGRRWCLLGHLGTSWHLLGSYWEALGKLFGSSWRPLGCLLAASWGSLGAVFGRSWYLLSGVWMASGPLGWKSDSGSHGSAIFGAPRWPPWQKNGRG